MTTRLVHLSDSHVKAGPPPRVPDGLADGVAALTGRPTVAALSAVLDAVREAGPFDLALHTGDVVDDGTEASYEEAFAVLARSGLDLEVVPGNHDDSGVLAEREGTAGGVRTRPLGPWTLVLVDSTVPGIEHGELGGDRLGALDAALRETRRPTLVAMHHPPVSSCADPDCQIRDAADLFEVLDRHDHVRVVANGHLHEAFERVRGGVTYMSGPSTCIQLRHEHPLPLHNRAATPVGARIIELHDDGTFESSLVWVELADVLESN